MGPMDVFKSLSTAPSSPVNKSKQHQDFIKILETLGIEPGAAGCEAQTLPLSNVVPHLVQLFTHTKHKLITPENNREV